MTQSVNQARRNEGGFTLVELAIVMIIIGLLIGGILKGQELINNARVSATVAQTKAVESGISGFRDKYSAIPGDMANPGGRIPNCVGFCATAGNGDGLVSSTTATTFDPGVAQVAGEMNSSFPQLASAGFIGGVGGGANAAAATAGVTNPTIPIAGAWKMGFNDDASMTGTAATVQSGTYIVSSAALATASSTAATYSLTPIQVETIDRKLDDGLPTSGSVVYIGGALGAATCASAAGVAPAPVTDSNYNTTLTTVLCGIAVKVM